MQRVSELPRSFERLRAIGGVIEFAVFVDAHGTKAEIVEAIASALPHGASFDAARLRSLGGHRIGERAFFGTWYDAESRSLIKVGEWRTRDGRVLRDPELRSLDGVETVSGGFSQPEPGSGGQLAYAFTTPPYSLSAQPSEVQALFDSLREFILPSWCASEIRDWSSPRLPEVSDYLDAGMEWWGVFLFSIHAPALGRLIIAMASATD